MFRNAEVAYPARALRGPSEAKFATPPSILGESAVSKLADESGVAILSAPRAKNPSSVSCRRGMKNKRDSSLRSE